MLVLVATTGMWVGGGWARVWWVGGGWAGGWDVAFCKHYVTDNPAFDEGNALSIFPCKKGSKNLDKFCFIQLFRGWQQTGISSMTVSCFCQGMWTYNYEHGLDLLHTSVNSRQLLVALTATWPCTTSMICLGISLVSPNIASNPTDCKKDELHEKTSTDPRFSSSSRGRLLIPESWGTSSSRDSHVPEHKGLDQHSTCRITCNRDTYSVLSQIAKMSSTC